MPCPQCQQPRAAHEPETICCAGARSEWHCRQCGATSHGFAFPYGRCPACGGDLALDQASSDPGSHTAALTAVRTAFEIELGGRAFYQRAAVDATDDDDARAVPPLRGDGRRAHGGAVPAVSM